MTDFLSSFVHPISTQKFLSFCDVHTLSYFSKSYYNRNKNVDNNSENDFYLISVKSKKTTSLERQCMNIKRLKAESFYVLPEVV